MEQNLDTLIRKKAFIKGLLLGVVGLALGIFSFYFITTMTDSMWLIIGIPMLISIILPIVIAVFFMLDLRKEIGGYWIFKQAVTGAFIMFFAAYLVSAIGRDLIFAKLIEPQMAQKTGEAVINATTKMLEASGADQSVIDEKIGGAQKALDAQTHTTIGKTIQGIIISILFVFVFALIYAAIFKKERPRNSLDTAIDPTV